MPFPRTLDAWCPYLQKRSFCKSKAYSMRSQVSQSKSSCFLFLLKLKIKVCARSMLPFFFHSRVFLRVVSYAFCVLCAACIPWKKTSTLLFSFPKPYHRLRDTTREGSLYPLLSILFLSLLFVSLNRRF